MTITEITAVAPTTRNAPVKVHAIRFSHPAQNVPASRWAAASPGSVHTPRYAPVRFLAPSDEHQPA